MLRRFSVAAAALLVGTTALASQTQSSADVERRADAILQQMTLEEKIDLLGCHVRRP